MSNIFFNVREVNDKDLYDIFEWRNEIHSREMSINSDKIDLESHKNWFYKKLKSNSTFLFIAEKNEDKIGIVRFDKTNCDTYEVSINLNPICRGKGYGKAILNQITDIFLSKYKNKIIVAEIKEINIASEKIFSYSGFKYIYKIDGKKSNIWIKSR